MTEWVFNRDRAQCFRFVRCDFSADTGVATLVYAFDDGPELIEAIQFPGAPFKIEPDRNSAIEHALHILHLIAGVSYYKAAVPASLVIESCEIDQVTAAMLQSIYENGLGEFAYRNDLNLRGKICFPCSQQKTSIAPSLNLREHALVAIGGGKDSLVSIETLRMLNVPQTVTWIGNSALIANCAAHTKLPTLNISRTLSPRLFDFNKQGAYNGHIPVTAINSAILVLAALLTNSNQVVFSNEHSASYGSLIPGTGEVNHQWSKGWNFEQMFSKYVVSHIATDLQYYSLLRPYSELAVTRQFAKLDKYDAYFSSCNRNFHILGKRPTQRWCGQCPKCHFVFLALAPFMPKPRLLAIFGRNLLDDLSLTADFDALLEYTQHKPFECVGEGRESRAAMLSLSSKPAWREDSVVARFCRDILPQIKDSIVDIESLLAPHSEHAIPPRLWERIRANFSA